MIWWSYFSLLALWLVYMADAGGKKSESIIVINNSGGGCGKGRANTIVTTGDKGKGKGKKGKGKGHKIILTSGGGGGDHGCSHRRMDKGMSRKMDLRRSGSFQLYPVHVVQTPFYQPHYPIPWSQWIQRPF